MITKKILIVPAVLALFANIAASQLSVRNSVATGGTGPGLMADGIVATGWSGGQSGASASLLLDDPVMLEAAFVLATGGTADADYELLASVNYREWDLLATGPAAQDPASGDITTFDNGQYQYIRLVNRGDSAFTWEVLAGSTQNVSDQLAKLRPPDWGDITDPVNILRMIDTACDWQLANPTTNQDGTGWVTGAFYTGVSGLYELTGDPKYAQAILDIGAFASWTLRLRTDGKKFYHADDHCLGQSWLDLYLKHPEPLDIWYADVKKRLDMVMAAPLQGRVDMNWCDALYMSPPNYVRIAEITGDTAYRTFIDTQWWDVTDFLYDTQHHLFYRDSSYFDDREPNGMPVFWSRGNGWVIGGLVRLLQHMPADWPKRPDYENLLREMSAALAAIQGADGLWSSSLLYPEKYDMQRETSGSAFFTYGIAYGINNGILDAATYGPVVEKAWAGMTPFLNANGTLEFIQQVGAGPALNNGLYLNKDYGYGAYILAGCEMIRYYAAKAQPATASYRKLETAQPAAQDATSWTKVDDFEGGYAWTESKTVPQSAVLLQDPYDPAGSRVFSIDTGNRTTGAFRATKSIPAIANGATGTVYQRFCYNNPEIDVLFGISDVALVTAYPDYENGLRVYFNYNQIEARSGGTYIPLDGDLLQLGTWYEAWTVINNASDTYDVYLQGGSNYPEQVLLKSGIPFRNGTSASIISYAVSYNSQYCEGAFYLDDLHVDNGGVNLTRPAGVRQPHYSPWSDIGRQDPNGGKQTGIGFLWDASFPYVYHAQLGGWCYVWPQETYPGGYYMWHYTDARWLWVSSVWPGWYYDYTAAAWRNAGQ